MNGQQPLPSLQQIWPHCSKLPDYLQGQAERLCCYCFHFADYRCFCCHFRLGKSVGSPPPPPLEGCGNSNGEVKEVQLNAAALTNPDSLHTPISLPSHSSVSSSGLVDSGSSHCSVDLSFVSLHSIPSYEISPVILCLLDRSVCANITCAADISIQFSTNDILPLKFYITKLDSTSTFVFGHNWLHRYNLSIDWSAGQILYFRQLPQSVPSSARSGPNISSETPASRPSASVPKPSVSSDSSSASNPSVPLGNSSLPPVSFINRLCALGAC